MMKKWLCFILCAVLMLSACAFGEGMELTIGKLAIAVNDEIMDFSGIDLKLAAGMGAERFGLRAGVEGNGTELASAAAATDGNALYLTMDGLSNTYYISFAELGALLGEAAAAGNPDMDINGLLGELNTLPLELLAQQLEGVLADVLSSVSDGGVQEIEGVTYQTMNFSVSEEQADALYRAVMDCLDGYPTLAGALLSEIGYESFNEFYQDNPLGVSLDGTFYQSENRITVDVYLHNIHDETMNIYLEMAMNDQDGAQMIELYGFIMEIEEDGGELFLTAGGTISTDAYGSFTALDGYLLTPAYGVAVPEADEDYEGIYFGAVAPQGDSQLWQIYLGSWDESVYMDFNCGVENGQDTAYVRYTEDDFEMSLSYTGKEGDGMLNFYYDDSYDTIAVHADVLAQEADGSWVDFDTSNAINALQMSSEQQEALSNQAMAVLLKLMAGIASANQTAAALIGSIM